MIIETYQLITIRNSINGRTKELEQLVLSQHLNHRLWMVKVLERGGKNNQKIRKKIQNLHIQILNSYLNF